MSEFRLWIHGKIARLDGTRERRFVALASALIFASLALGPQALRAVDGVVNAPDIRIDELGANPIPNPVRFKATTLNIVLENVEFLVTGPEGALPPVRGHRASTADPSLWVSEDFKGIPGQKYEVRAKGSSDALKVSSIESSKPVAFEIFDASKIVGTAPTTDATSDAAGAVKISEITGVAAVPGVSPRIEAQGRHDGFEAVSAFFRIKSITGLAFQSDREAARFDGNVWKVSYEVPGGEAYRVTFYARESNGSLRESAPRDVSVPPAEKIPVAAETAPTLETAPQPQPIVTLLLPSAGGESLSPITLSARVANATATKLIFEVIDPAKVPREIVATTDGAREWTAKFFGVAGGYDFRARALLTDGRTFTSGDVRLFKILPDATETEKPPATEEPVAAPTDEPVVEIFAPADSATFPGLVSLEGRVRNGVPDKVAAIVLGPKEGETFVPLSKTATGDFWTKTFDVPDGEYRFRLRATVAGKDYFSAERRFVIKRPPAAPLPSTDEPGPLTNVPIVTSPVLKDGPGPLTNVPIVTSPVLKDGPGPLTNVPIVTSPVLKDGPPPVAATVDTTIPEAMQLECRAAGILPARCMDWLKTKHQSRECLDAGATTRESCAELLRKLNIASDETKTFGMATDRDIQDAAEAARRLDGKAVKPSEMPPAIGRLLAFEPRPEERWRVMASQNDSTSLLILDNDGDGLPDDAERRFGTDPNAADTDGDGFSDGEEVKNGYNPLGPGALEKPVRGLDKATLDRRAIEEPRGSSAPADPSFTIAAEADAPETDGEVIRLSGTAAPNSVVSIFVYSYLPVVVTTTTDENGDWTYDFGSKLAEGRHEAYVSVNDDTGKLVAASSPLAFFVREAQAVSEEDFLRPDINIEETHVTFSRWFIYGGIGLVALALLLVVAIIRQARKTDMTGMGGTV